MRITILTGLSLAAGLSTACIWVHATDDSHHSHSSESGGPRASAKIEARSGSTVSGTATFTETKGGVLVEIEIHHAPPGWHAAHIHEKGDCSAEDGTSAGGHFNPAGKNHGSPHPPQP